MQQLISRLSRFITEVISIVTSKEKLGQLWGIRLYSNALYLMLGNAASALLGFAFWIIVTRLYPQEDVGLASAAISAACLLATFAIFGFEFGLIRFLSQSGKNANLMINSCLTISSLASVVAVLIFLGGLGVWSRALLSLRQRPSFLIAFLIFTAAYTITSLLGGVFIAKRQAGFNLATNLIFGLLRLPLPIVLVLLFHDFGIFASWGIPVCIVLLVCLLLFVPRVQPGYHPRFTISWGLISEIGRFSFTNYIASFFYTAPGFILPIMMVNVLGTEANAYFYAAWIVGTMLFSVSLASSFSLFAEGSYDEEKLGGDIWRALKFTFLILVPAVILVLVFSDKLLLLFGSSYAQNATTLLRILAISALPAAVSNIYLGIKRVEKKLTVIMTLSSLIAVVTLVLSYLLLPSMGIKGAGIAWLISQGIAATVIVARLLFRQATVSKRLWRATDSPEKKER